ncbi:hypothetical protein TKK_0018844 [Trichogramma kaykai]
MRVYSVLFLVVSTALVANAGLWGSATSWFNKQVHVVQAGVEETVKKAEETVNLVGKQAQDAADYAKNEAKKAEESINSIGKQAEESFNSINKQAQDSFNSINKQAQDTYSDSANWVVSQANAVKDAAKQVENSVNQFGQNARDTFANAAKEIDNLVSQANLENLAKRIEAEGKKIEAFSQQQFEALQSSINPKDLTDLGKSLTKNFESMASDIEGTYKQARDALNKDKIMSMYQDVKNAAEGKFLEMQDTLIKTLKEQVGIIPEKAFEAVQVLKVGALNMKQQLNNTLQAVVKKADDEIEQIIKAVEGTGIDVRSCQRSVGYQLQLVLKDILGSSTGCFNQKLSEGSLLFCHITDNVRGIAEDLASLGSGDVQKVQDLVQHSFGMVSKATATADMLYTLPQSLTNCVNMMNFGSLSTSTSHIVKGVKECVNDQYKQFVSSVKAGDVPPRQTVDTFLGKGMVAVNDHDLDLICSDDDPRAQKAALGTPARPKMQCPVIAIPL